LRRTLASKREKIERGDWQPSAHRKWQSRFGWRNAAKETYRLAARHGRAREDFSAIYAFRS